ncbi:hypothetical protein M501DRAFT_1032892 [Patellaria atrata CBS 101060]|uniref:Uncharacterized protein n=1 Tax=Patellaria atrata CBS 101060 TaxID=1346257 RepID=A0A9P4VPU8_9PEZI|nr:hypothetical protein M501DRAFT_1032892 [Patellaria atrata CBS 101060]
MDDTVATCCDDDADFFNLPQGTSTAYISTLGGLNGAGPTSGEDSPSPALTASATPSSQIGPQTSISNPDVDSKSSSLTAGEIAAIPSSISAAIFLAGIGIYIIRRRHLNHLAKKQDSNELGIPELGVSSSYLQEIDAVEPGTREIEVVENPSWEAGGRALIAELETHVERSELEGEKLDQIESG